LISTLFPRSAAEQHQHGEDLQSSHDHAQGQHDLGQIRQSGEIAAGANQVKTGTHVAHAGQGRAEGGSEGVVVQRHHKHTGQNDGHIAAHKDQNGVDGLFFHHFAVQLDDLHPAGVADPMDLPADGPEQQQDTGALHAAAGGAGAGAAEHQQDHDSLREGGPEHEVGGGKAGGGDDGAYLEEGVAQTLPQGAVDGEDVDGDQHGGSGDHDEEEAQLVAGQGLFKTPGQHQEVQREVQGEQQDENGDDELDHGIAVGAHAGVAVGEAAGAGGAEGVDKAVVQGHTRQLQTQCLSQSEGAVDAVEDFGGLGLLGHQLGEDGAGSLGLREVVGADAHGGQKSRGQHQHAHTAQPVGEGAPEEDAAGHGFNIGENGGAGGGKAGDGFKKAVDEGGDAAADEEGQRTHHAGSQPDKTHGAETLAGEELGLGLQPGQTQGDCGHDEG